MTFTDQATGTLPHSTASRPDSPLPAGPSLADAPVASAIPGRAAQTGIRRSPVDTRTADPVLDVTIPVFNEERDLEECLRRLHAYLLGSFPHTLPDHGGGQRQHRRNAQDGRTRGPRTPRGDRWSTGREGPRQRAAQRVARLAVAGPGLHGRGPVHRSGGPGAPAGAADFRTLGPRHRDPADAQFPRGPRAQAGIHLPQLQLPAALLHGRPLQRRAVRVQGHPGGRGPAAPPAHPGQCLVLRHRTAGAGRKVRAARPRGAGGLDRRSRFQRRHRPDRPG